MTWLQREIGSQLRLNRLNATAAKPADQRTSPTYLQALKSMLKTNI